MFDNTAEVLELRPKANTKNMELFKAIHRAQHVQRNFDLSKSMPEQDIATVVTAATQCASKQNIAFYKVHAITNRDVIEEIYECTTCSPDSSPKASGQGTARSMYTASEKINLSRRLVNYPENPQVLANLVLVFEEYENFNNNPKTPNNNPQTFVAEVEKARPLLEDASAWKNVSKKEKLHAMRVLEVLNRQGIDVHDKDALDGYITRNREILSTDRDTALGIAAGTVNLTASQLGYGTGCCTCIMDAPRMKKLLGLEGKALLVMGIGFKKEGMNRRLHHKDDSYMFETRKKQPIEVNYVH